MTNGVAVLAEGVSKRYETGAQTVAALCDVSLTVPTGQFVAVVGPSGSGKSTLLHLVAGLDRPSAGRVVVAGEDLARLSEDARSDLRLRRIGFVFQSFNLFPTFTAHENTAWPLEFLGRGRRVARERAAVCLERAGVPAATWGRRPAALSGGEQQRVAIARALVAEPDLLVADEPTGNLDSRTGETVLALLRGLCMEQGLTIVMVTHSPFAAAASDRTLELRDGRIVRDERTRLKYRVAAPAPASR